MAAAFSPSAAHIDVKGKGRALPLDTEATVDSMQAKLLQWRRATSSKRKPYLCISTEFIRADDIPPNLTANARPQPRRVSEIDLLRDAVLALQGIDGHYTHFQDAASGVERDKRGLPIHPLEQGNGTGRVEGQLLFVQPGNDVSLFIHIEEFRSVNLIGHPVAYTPLYSSSPHAFKRGRMALSSNNTLHREKSTRACLWHYRASKNYLFLSTYITVKIDDFFSHCVITSKSNCVPMMRW